MVKKLNYCLPKRYVLCFDILCFFILISFYIKKRQRRTAAFPSTHEPVAGPSSAIDFQGSDMDLYSDADVDVDEESNYDNIHAGYDIHDPDIVCTLKIITASV